MKRARGNAVPISLFAFQDIITSVSGIMLFMTLLLCLELVDQQAQSARISVSPEAPRLQRTLAALEQERAQLQALVNQSHDELAELLATGEVRLTEQERDLRAQIERAESEIETLDDLIASARERQSRAVAEAASRGSDRAQLQQQLVQLAALRSKVQSALDPKKVRYSFPDERRRGGWLVELAAGIIQAAPLQIDQAPIRFEGTGDALERLLGASGTQKFIAWAGDRPVSERYFLLVVRPDGHERYDQISEAFRGENIAFGYDLIGYDQQVLDPEHGAVEP